MNLLTEDAYTLVVFNGMSGILQIHGAFSTEAEAHAYVADGAQLRMANGTYCTIKALGYRVKRLTMQG